MKTVILRGPALTHSGYGQHTRQIAKWLLSRKDLNVKFHTLPWGDTPWAIDANAYDGLVGEVIRRGVDGNAKADVSIQLQLPNEWDPTIAPINVGVTAGVESDRCNPKWVTACNTMNKIIVPSQHALLSLTNSGPVNVPIDVIPESYVESVKSPTNVTLPDFSTPFNFLLFGQLTGNNPHNDRKNTFFTLKWLCETFKDDKDVGIVIKTNAGRNTKIDRNIVRNVLTNIVTEARRGSPYPKVHLLHGDMNDDEVAALYKHHQIKALVALTRGEGFGLPILEAAASALPVIVTGWSGHLDFMKQGKFVNVYYQLGEVHPSRIDDTIFMKGAKWANPDEADFKKKVTKFRQNSTTPKEWALDLSSKLLKSHDHANISSMYDVAFKDIL